MGTSKVCVWGLITVLLVSCVSATAEPFTSPITIKREVYKQTYLPLAIYSIAKKGLALNRGYCDDAVIIGAAWIYSWGHTPPSCWYIEAVPMLWSPKQVGLPVAQSRYLLGFNECDRADQCNTAAQDAIHDWRQVELLYYDRLLVSPAPSSDDIDWLRRFREAYLAEYKVPPKFYALAAHCYLPDAAECITIGKQYIQWAKEWHVPGGVWFTEWAFGPCTVVQAQTTNSGTEPATLTAKREAEIFRAWLESEPTITRYAWFTNRLVSGDSGSYPDPSCNTVLISKDGSLTILGQWYTQPQ